MVLIGAALVTGLGLVFVGCELDTDELPERNEQTHQGMYLGSLGDGITAGYTNGGIEQTVQHACFPNLLSQLITGRAVQMPLVASPGIGSESGLSALFINEDGDLTREPIPADPTELALNLTYPVPYDNLGLPGSTTDNILNATEGGAFDLVLRAAGLPSAGTAIEGIELIQPNIITLWTGNSEILGGTLSGTPQNTNPAEPGFVVPVSVFEEDFNELCDRIAALNPAMVVVANILPTTNIPYTRFFGTGAVPGINRWVMEEDILSQTRDDSVQIVLISSPISDCPGCYLPSCQFDPATPCDTIPANQTLSFAEVALIENTIDAYNTFIASEVANRGWALVDINTALNGLPGTPSDDLNSFFPWVVNPLTGVGVQNKGSAFGLDGIHPSEKGHAFVANLFLDAINALYGTSYPPFDVAGVENVAGFQRAPSSSKAASISPFTPAGREGLQAVAEMMRYRWETHGFAR
jgi:hypothetical protein